MQLLYVELHEVYRCVFNSPSMADPGLQVIYGGLGEGLAEPRRAVELAAIAGGTAASTIPQKVMGEEISSYAISVSMISRVTEIVIFNKSCAVWPSVAVSAVAHIIGMNVWHRISSSGSKGPDVLP